MPPKAHAETGMAHVSASRERGYLDCKRSYWWAHGPLKVPSPSKPHFDFGTAMHRVGEFWLRDGTPPGAWAEATVEMLGLASDVDAATLAAARALHAKAAPVFAAGVQYWPLPGRVQVESPFAVPVTDRPGEFFTGTMDVWDKRANIIATWSGADRVEMQQRYGTYALPTVGDHKSTKAEKWIKTVDDLMVDPQVIDYGMEALRRMPGAPAVAFQWVYYLTQGTPQAWPVRFHLPAAYIEERWARAQETHRDMVDIVQITDYRKVPTNEKSCKKFGGCSFLDYCFGGKKPTEVDVDVTKTKAWAKLKQDGGINPPPQPMPATVATSATPTPAPIANTATKANIFNKATSAPTSATTSAVVTQPAMVTSVTSSATPAPAPVVLPTPEVVRTPKPAPKPDAGMGFVLLVDACADKTNYQPDYMTELFAEPMQQVADAFKVPNWRYIPYGEGKAALAKAVDDWLDTNPYSGILRLDTGTEEGNALLPVLFPRATLVVRGAR